MVLQVFAGVWIAIIHQAFRNLAPRLCMNSEEPHPAVQKARSTCDKVDHIILDQHAAMNWPDGLKLLEGHQPLVTRRGTKSPGKLAVTGSQTVHPTIRRTENRAAFVNRRR